MSNQRSDTFQWDKSLLKNLKKSERKEQWIQRIKLSVRNNKSVEFENPVMAANPKPINLSVGVLPAPWLNEF